MNNLPKVVTQLLPRVGLESVDRKSNALSVAPPRIVPVHYFLKGTYIILS